MIEIENKSRCCGCGACVQRCPKQCIALLEDEEGFLYPQVDKAVCIDCGLCEKVCPVINQAEPKDPLKVYAAKNSDMHKRQLSSSGGLFIALAEKTIEKGGVVFGVVFDENWEAHHVAATTIEELQPMMRSKYIQSRTENTFAEAEKYLNEGREVMYTGTSCQIAALKLFLRKEYENLLAVDVICHGAPSPLVWRKYLEELRIISAQSAAAGKNTVLSSSLKDIPVVTGISFREKKGFGWKKYGFVVKGKSPLVGEQNSVLWSSYFPDNPYAKAFIVDLPFRPSCYECPAKGGRSRSDITIADYWGVDKIHPNFDDDAGCSVMFVHSSKGQSIVSTLNIDVMPILIEEATRFNRAYYVSAHKSEKRDVFFREIINGGSVIKTSLKLTRPPIQRRIKQWIKRQFMTSGKR